jgi:dihydroneopterin aldolase
MAGNEQARQAIPEQFVTIEAAAEFWDSHDLADYEDLTSEVKVAVQLQRRRRLVALAPELAEQLRAAAQQRGVSAETLVNLWLRERLQATE